MKIFESFKKLFDREPNYGEVAIQRREKFWDEKYRRLVIQNKWDARREQRKQKMKDAANLYIYRKPIARQSYLGYAGISCQGSPRVENLNGLAATGIFY